MYKISVKEAKTQLRKHYRCLRNSLDNHSCQYDSRVITEKIIRSPWYQNAETVFVYVSMKNEVDTRMLIDYALKHGKKVAVPCCIPEKGTMDFYYIRSLQDLHKGYFGVDEPSLECSEKVTVKQGVIIVPALAFDGKGYRMGYGKGYYDRYLADFKGVKIGICYHKCFRRCMIHDRFDQRVNYIITDNFTKFIAK